MANVKVRTWISSLGEVEVCSQKELMDKYGIDNRMSFTRKQGAPDNRPQPDCWHGDFPRFQAFWKSEDDFNKDGFTKKKMYTAEMTKGNMNKATGQFEWYPREEETQFYFDALDDLAGRHPGTPWNGRCIRPIESNTYVEWFKATFDLIENRPDYRYAGQDATVEEVLEIMLKDFDEEVYGEIRPKTKWDYLYESALRAAADGCENAQYTVNHGF